VALGITAAMLATVAGGCGTPRPGERVSPNPVETGGVLSEVRLTITPVRVEAGGELLVALFRDEGSWLDDSFLAQTVPADRDTARVVFPAVPVGSYAAAVIHDENGNGKLDTRTFPFPKPTEGLAVSNNTWGFGRPEWGPAVFQLGAEPVELDLELRYF
jgi:uncharacterized protein (DUF2141 family)